MTLEGWSRRTIGELCDFSSGYGFRPPDWSKEGLPIIRIQNLNGSKEFNYFKGTPDESWLVEPGTILFAWAGTRGISFGPTIWNGPRGVLNQHIYRVHPREDVNPLWLYAALEAVTRNIERKAHGFKATLLHVRKEEITSQALHFPPPLEQQLIVDILSIWDRAIDLTAQLIAAKQQRKLGLMQQLLTGKRRFKHFVCSEETQDTEIGPVPADWRYISIGDIAQHVSERNTSGLDLPVLSCTKYEGLVESLRYFGRQIFSNDTSVYKVVRHHQFAYATNHIEEGSIGYQDLYDEALISPMYTVFEADPTVNDRFLYALLKTETYRQIFERSTSASVDRRGSLRWNEFSRIKVPLPSLWEQEAITAVLDTCDSELVLLERKLTLLKKQKQGLMQQLLTGKVRVKT